MNTIIRQVNRGKVHHVPLRVWGMQSLHGLLLLLFPEIDVFILCDSNNIIVRGT